MHIKHKKGPHAVVLSRHGHFSKLITFRDKAQALKYVKNHKASSSDLWASYWGKVPVYGALARRTRSRRSR